MIKISNLKKQFGEQEVLKDISMEIKDGEVVALIGPSGSGKSTLLRCLNYLEEPDDGRIRIGEVDIDVNNTTKDEITQLRQQTSMVFQHYNLFKNKTALENVTYALEAAKKYPKEEARKIGMDLLVKVGMADKADTYPIQLSGGQQQRIGIARALAVDPYAVLFDEPTSSLDPEWVGEVLKVISEIADGSTTMIVVTHEMDFARKVADKVIFMDEGYIVEEGLPEAVLNHPVHERTKRFLQNYQI